MKPRRALGDISNREAAPVVSAAPKKPPAAAPPPADPLPPVERMHACKPAPPALFDSSGVDPEREAAEAAGYRTAVCAPISAPGTSSLTTPPSPQLPAALGLELGLAPEELEMGLQVSAPKQVSYASLVPPLSLSHASHFSCFPLQASPLSKSRMQVSYASLVCKSRTPPLCLSHTSHLHAFPTSISPTSSFFAAPARARHWWRRPRLLTDGADGALG